MPDPVIRKPSELPSVSDLQDSDIFVVSTQVGTSPTSNKITAADVKEYMGSGGSGGGAESFTDLSDTPNTLSGLGGQTLRVNAGATAIEVYDPEIPESLSDLEDGPPPLVGIPSTFLRVNSAGTALEGMLKRAAQLFIVGNTTPGGLLVVDTPTILSWNGGGVNINVGSIAVDIPTGSFTIPAGGAGIYRLSCRTTLGLVTFIDDEADPEVTPPPGEGSIVSLTLMHAPSGGSISPTSFVTSGGPKHRLRMSALDSLSPGNHAYAAFMNGTLSLEVLISLGAGDAVAAYVSSNVAGYPLLTHGSIQLVREW